MVLGHDPSRQVCVSLKRTTRIGTRRWVSQGVLIKIKAGWCVLEALGERKTMLQPFGNAAQVHRNSQPSVDEAEKLLEMPDDHGYRCCHQTMRCRPFSNATMEDGMRPPRRGGNVVKI